MTICGRSLRQVGSTEKGPSPRHELVAGVATGKQVIKFLACLSVPSGDGQVALFSDAQILRWAKGEQPHGTGQLPNHERDTVKFWIREGRLGVKCEAKNLHLIGHLATERDAKGNVVQRFAVNPVLLDLFKQTGIDPSPALLPAVIQLADKAKAVGK